MKITEVTLENYRSIEKLSIDLSSQAGSYCKILTGINEAGKSNILKGLALLSKSSEVSYLKDANKKAKRSKDNICAKYKLDESSHEIVLEQLLSMGAPQELIDKIRIKDIFRVVTIHPSSVRTDHYYMYVEDGSESLDYEFNISTKGFKKIDGDPKPSDDSIIPANLTEFESIFEEYLLTTMLESHIPHVVFWKYSDSYLINKPIDLAGFATDPVGNSKPLRNVFILAGYQDAQIANVINEALTDGAQMGEMQDNLGKALTTYMRKVWPEHAVEVLVHTDSTTLNFHIKESDKTATGRYEVLERSDGFRHFFAILLNLAVENTNEQLKDSLILLDEPEVHLHPSGAKFLRDELLKIAKNNNLLYATHSIFMIDKKSLSRHYKVTKEDETTHVLAIDESNPFKEELIYEALGTSVLGLISEHNILFEGLTDKKLFDAFNHKFKVDIKPLELNTITVDSEQHFEQYCQFFNKKNIKGYIVADSDTAGVSAKKRIVDVKPGYNSSNVFVINDILNTDKDACLEDLLPQDVLQTCIQEFAGVSLLLSPDKTFKEQIIAYNKASGGKVDPQKLKMHICDHICNDISKKQMTRERTIAKYGTYHSFVVSLNSLIKKAS